MWISNREELHKLFFERQPFVSANERNYGLCVDCI